MRVNRFFIPATVLIVLLGTIFLAQISGLWIVSGRTTTNLVNLTPADLKGWMTLQQVIDGIPIGKDELYALAGISPDIPTTTALKDIEALVDGFETSTLRDALVAQLPQTEEAKPAAAATSQTMNQTPAQSTTSQPETMATPKVSDERLPADQIRGKMTLREVSEQCQVPLSDLLAALNLVPESNPDAQIKALVDAGMLSEVAQVQQAVSTLQQKRAD